MAGTKVVIIGGGAAGLTAGVLCARAGCVVTMLEKTEVCGRKLSMTGNGRCNLSNLAMEASCYNEAAAPLLEQLLGRFGVREATDFFDSVGVLVRGEEGYLYPVSGQAQTVTDALLHAFLSAGGEILYRRQAKEILAGEAADDAAWVVRTAGERYPADAVLLASGALSGPKTTKSTGDGYYIAEQLGAEIVPTTPALCGLQCAEVTLPKESGVRVFATVRCFAGEPDAAKSVLLAEECGEVQLTAGRISGIPVMQLSSACARLLAEGKAVTLSLDLFPETADADFEDMIRARVRGAYQQTLGDFLRGFAHTEINRMVAERFGYSVTTPLTEVTPERLTKLLRAYRDLPFGIGGTDDYVHAQATAGGIALSSLNEALALKTAPGVYCIGEVTDVNGRCGGYNLQWAWTSAMCAAEAVTGLNFPRREG